VSYELKLPDLGEGLTDGEIGAWLVSEGDTVEEDQPLLEVQTDKTTVEIPSPAAGRIGPLLVGAGQTVPVGTLLVVIDDGTAGTATPAAAAPERVRALPAVRRLAQELGVALDGIAGSGANGEVTESDVRAAAPSVPGEGRREPLRGVRRQIAQHLTRAQAIPAVTWVDECCVDALEEARAGGSLVQFLLRATSLALADFPALNARLEGEEIVYLDRYDLGLAVQTERGLVVPVVRGCDRLGRDELAAEVERLVAAARTDSLAPEELRGSTFTVTSAGRLAGTFATPLVNEPEVAILGLHRIVERVVLRGGQAIAEQVANVSVTFDHRVVDGAVAAQFGLRVIALLEAPGDLWR
jgi:pyruvate/2-oxoglutarate dehydrogenase complex dihydrolipoamide acyltransferase (E2) component